MTLRPIRWRLLSVALALMGAAAPPLAAPRGALLAGQSEALKIVVIEGEGAVNIIRQGTATTPIVEVRDRNDQPVSGAIVTFAVRGGRATINGVQTLTVTTNAAGRAAVTGLLPTSSGPLDIGVSAVYQGQTATATIAQTNAMAAAQASGTSAGAGSHGMSGVAKAGLWGGVASAGGVAGWVAYKRLLDPEYYLQDVRIAFASGPGVVTSFPLATLPARFHASGFDDRNQKMRFAWDFGDGGTSSEQEPSHVYANAGTFTVTLTLSDDKSSATTRTAMLVETLTGTWLSTGTPAGPNLGPWRLVLTQLGGSLTGTAQPGTLAVGTVAGTLGATSPPVSFTIRGSGVADSTFSLFVPGGTPFNMSGMWNDANGSRGVNFFRQ